MSLDDTRFTSLSNATLEQLFSRLEPAFELGALEELELNDGILTIETSSGKTFVISRHAPSHQLWLASPLSGGHHFSFNASHNHWALPNGTTLLTLLSGELEQLAGVKDTL